MTYLILTIVILGVLTIIATSENFKLKQELKQKEKQEKQNAKIDKDTVEKIESITTGNMEHDFNSGIELLHQLSQK